MKILLDLLLIASGGAVGAITRYLIHIGSLKLFGENFPIGTLVVNVVGCFLIGWFVGCGQSESQKWALAFGFGFLGSLTTFSTFGIETIQYAEAGRAVTSFLSVSANLLLGLVAVMLGMWFGRNL